MTTTPTPSKSRAKASNGRRKSAAQPTPIPANLTEHIAVAAYFKAQARGFAPGSELDDWLQAESEFGFRPGAA